MLISAGGSSGGRGLASASGIVSPPSPSPPPAMRHSPRPRLPPPLSAESRASPPLKGRIVRLEEAAVSGRQKASCLPHRRHPCRRASAALGGCLDRDGGPRRRLRAAILASGTPLPRRRLPGAHPQPRSPRAASAPVAPSRAASPRKRLRAFPAEQPVPGCGMASCRCRLRPRAAAARRSFPRSACAPPCPNRSAASRLPGKSAKVAQLPHRADKRSPGLPVAISENTARFP
jgi:hypothetical protein